MNCTQCTNTSCKIQLSKGVTPTLIGEITNPELPPITSVFFILTQACNLACKYCFIEKNPKHMTYQVAKDATDFIIKNAELQGDVPMINFFGGEPLLKWDEIIVPLTNYIRQEYKKPFTLSMTSNCVLMTREKLEFMKENNIGLLFSIDGDKETQDLNRPLVGGQPSFNLLADKIPMILEYYPNMTFRMTLDHDNSKQIVANHKFAVESGYNNTFMAINEFVDWTEDEKLELKQGVHDLADYYMDLLREGRSVDFNPFMRLVKEIKRINTFAASDMYRNITTEPAYGKCGMGASKFASVGTDGMLYSCQEMVGNTTTGDLFVIGNIYDGVSNDKRWEIINMFDVMKVRCQDEGMCSNCKLKAVCDGYCVINNYFVTQDFNIVPSIFCYYYQLLLEEAIRVMNTMAMEQNQTFRNIFTKL